MIPCVCVIHNHSPAFPNCLNISSHFRDNIVSLAIGSSNAFALVTGALLLGSGLVEIPRGLWQNADLSHRYRWLLRRVARATQRLDVAHRELSTAIVVSCCSCCCWLLLLLLLLVVAGGCCCFRPVGSVLYCITQR